MKTRYDRSAFEGVSKYRPSNRMNFVKNGLRAIRRSESYDFRSSANTIPFSSEMLAVQTAKLKSFADPPDPHWSDRYSGIAAPLGAELFLQCERSIPEVMLGGSRFFMGDIAAEEEPDARSKFPYSDSAHRAAKIVTAQYKKNLVIKQQAALQIQALYRGVRCRKMAAPLFAARAHAAAVIHREYKARNSFAFLVKLRARKEVHRVSLLPKPWKSIMSEEEVQV